MNRLSSRAKVIDTYGGYTLYLDLILDDEGFDKKWFDIYHEGEYVEHMNGFTYDTDYDDVIQSFRNWVDYKS